MFKGKRQYDVRPCSRGVVLLAFGFEKKLLSSSGCILNSRWAKLSYGEGIIFIFFDEQFTPESRIDTMEATFLFILTWFCHFLYAT